MNDTSNLIKPGEKFTGDDGKIYVTTGEFRPPKCFEAYLSRNSLPRIACHNWNVSAIILRELPPPPKPRRVPTDQDALHRPKCWVKWGATAEWSPETQTLIAVVPGSSRPFKTVDKSGAVDGWPYCEIEDVPLGPVYHWRDATSEDVGKWFQAAEFSDAQKYWSINLCHSEGVRVLVEVGK